MPEDVEVTKESLLSLASDFDAGKPIDTPLDAAKAADPAVKTDKPELNPDEKKDVAEATPKAGEADKTKAPKTDADKQKSKWAQNEERKSKTWQDINAEKEAIKAERDRLQRERDEIQTKRAAAEVLRDEHGATAQDYRSAAAKFKEQGNAEYQAAAEKLADQLEKKAGDAKQAQITEANKAQWIANFNALAEKNPALKDPNSDISKAAVGLLKEFPLLTQTPQGINYAVRAAEIELQGKGFEGTKAEFAKLKEEHAKLQKKLSISGGSPTASLPESKSFKDMSLKEQRASLEQQVAQHDRDNGL